MICGGSAFAQKTLSSPYQKKLHEYLEAGGTLASFRMAVTGMIDNMSKQNDKIPSEFWTEFEKEVLGTSLDDLVVLLEPVYKNHLTEADLDALIAFYKSPVGKKLATETPKIMQESMQAGEVWGQALGEKIVARMKEKGYN
jgi:hypothetical protein